MMGVLWVAVGLLGCAVIGLGWLVRELRVDLAEVRGLIATVGSVGEKIVAGVKDGNDEYKDTIHALGLWQEGIEQSLSDLNVRVAKNTAAIDVQPDTAAIITAVTAPMLELMRPAPFQPADNRAPNDPAEPDDTSWIDTWDPTDDEFPLDRDPSDFTPPPAFGGLPGLGG